jgi:cbb3-type cytochrome oxidase subunit 3
MHELFMMGIAFALGVLSTLMLLALIIVVAYSCDAQQKEQNQ